MRRGQFFLPYGLKPLRRCRNLALAAPRALPSVSFYSSSSSFGAADRHGKESNPRKLKKHKVERWNVPPTPKELQTNFMKDGGRPVVFQGLLNEWPALRAWQDLHYFAQREEVMVPVEVGRHYLDPHLEQRTVSLAEFVAYLRDAEANENKAGDQSQEEETKWYLAQHPLLEEEPTLFSRDVIVPRQYTQHSGRGDYYGSRVWFGPKGTVTPLHRDPYRNLLAQVVGSKYVRLYRPEDQEKLYPFLDMFRKNASQVPLHEVEPKKKARRKQSEAEDDEEEETKVLGDRFPMFVEADYWECVLEPGDTLFIPIGHWHYVRSLSRSFSVSFWWQ
ncbi:Lysine-specific demethylase 8 [Balamuthia mandrillaris]